MGCLDGGVALDGFWVSLVCAHDRKVDPEIEFM